MTTNKASQAGLKAAGRSGAVLFHLAREAGLEFIFSSGSARSRPPHTHSTSFCLTLVRQGSVAVARPDGLHRYGPGAFYIDAPDEIHSPAYGDNYDLVSLCLKRDRLARSDEAAVKRLVLDYAARLGSSLSSENIESLMNGVEAVCRRPGYRLKYNERGQAGEGFEGLISPDEGGGKISLYPPGASASRFSRRFKAVFGLTPHRYLLQNRLRAAKERLNADCPIVIAAQEAGFCDQSHLNRCFKKSLGLTPREYIAACRFF